MIEIKEINKRFEDVQAVSDLTMKIVEGEIFGLVGTNGAGKSTLMRMICGILRPDEGEITVDGEQIYENPKMKDVEDYNKSNIRGISSSRIPCVRRASSSLWNISRNRSRFPLAVMAYP